MTESKFIKTVVFGGYDKNEVDKRFNYLYELVFDTKNKLRETKLLLDKMKGGADEQSAIDSVIAEERAKLTELQVKNQNLLEKVKMLDDELARKKQELQATKTRLEGVERQLGEAEAKLASEGGSNQGAMLNVVFQQAQSSANMILSTAQQQAADLENDSKKLAENTVTDANNKAKMIIYEAENKASEIISAAKERSSAMEVASGNIKASVLSDVKRMEAELDKFKSIFDRFEKAGTEMISQSQGLLKEAAENITADGVPVFREPERTEVEMVERPTLENIDDSYITGNREDTEKTKKKNDALKKLKEKAESIGGESTGSGSGKKVSLADLAKKAESFN